MADTVSITVKIIVILDEKTLELSDPLNKPRSDIEFLTENENCRAATPNDRKTSKKILQQSQNYFRKQFCFGQR